MNYIGKHEQVDDIEITPILFRKGKTTIAVYALGAIRDERLVGVNSFYSYERTHYTERHVVFT